MAGQKFYASPTDTFTWANGAVGHRAGGPFDTLGPYAKVRNCPIDGTQLRLTCYATAYADTWFSVPAVTEHKGKRIAGYFTTDEDGIHFRVMNRHRHLVGLPWDQATWVAELDKIADAAGCEPNGDRERALQRTWLPLYQQGLTPQQAWDKTPWIRNGSFA